MPGSEEICIFVSFACEIIYLYLITGLYNLIEVAIYRNSQILENLMMGSGELVQLASAHSVCTSEWEHSVRACVFVAA